MRKPSRRSRRRCKQRLPPDDSLLIRAAYGAPSASSDSASQGPFGTGRHEKATRSYDAIGATFFLLDGKVIHMTFRPVGK